MDLDKHPSLPPDMLRTQASGNASTASDRGPIADKIIQQAIEWYVQRASGTISAHDEAAFKKWREANPDHVRAWARLQTMGGRLRQSTATVAPEVAHETLARLASHARRRQLLKAMAWIGVGGSSLYLLREEVPWKRKPAGVLYDVHTTVGEQRSLVLQDGTLLQLNTGTAVDLRFDSRERRIVLRNGEIMVATGHDPAQRPFIVSTSDGLLTPLGTRFTVRRDQETSAPRSTLLSVTEGKVRIQTYEDDAGGEALAQAGQAIRFTRSQILSVGILEEQSQAWTEGLFVAERMRLADFLAELDRYRRGQLRYAPEVANLRITGVWPLDDPDATDRILESLARRLPVRIKRFTRYWTKVVAS